VARWWRYAERLIQSRHGQTDVLADRLTDIQTRTQLKGRLNTREWKTWHQNPRKSNCLFCLLLCWRTPSLPYWRLDAKRPYLLPSSKSCGLQSSRTEGHQLIIDCPQPGSSWATYRPPPLGRWSKCGGNDTVMVLLGSGTSKVLKETQLEWLDPAWHW